MVHKSRLSISSSLHATQQLWEPGIHSYPPPRLPPSSMPPLSILICFLISTQRISPSKSSLSSNLATPIQPSPISSTFPGSISFVLPAITSRAATNASWIYAKLKPSVISAMAPQSLSGNSISRLSASFDCQKWQYAMRSSKFGSGKKYFLSKREGRF